MRMRTKGARFACELLGWALLVVWVAGCSRSTTGAPQVAGPRAAVADKAPSKQDADDVALDVARTFMQSLLTKESTTWRSVTSLPCAWEQRCALLTDWAPLSTRVVAQRPPPGVVKVGDVKWAKRPTDADEGAIADAWRVLSDIRSSCGNPKLDATMAKLHGYDHVLIHVTLATPEGPHPVILRTSRIAGRWRVTGLRSR